MKNHLWRSWLVRLSRSFGDGVRQRRPAAGRQPRPRLEALESRLAPAVAVTHSYDVMDSDDSTDGFLHTPPDTCGAAGPNSYVETVNNQVTIFTGKTTATP